MVGTGRRWRNHIINRDFVRSESVDLVGMILEILFIACLLGYLVIQISLNRCFLKRIGGLEKTLDEIQNGNDKHGNGNC